MSQIMGMAQRSRAGLKLKTHSYKYPALVRREGFAFCNHFLLMHNKWHKVRALHGVGPT